MDEETNSSYGYGYYGSKYGSNMPTNSGYDPSTDDTSSRYTHPLTTSGSSKCSNIPGSTLSSITTTTTTTSRPTGRGCQIMKICGVCGDKAKSYHFGGISCDSCKAFFRRSVQSDAYRNFSCPYARNCDITILSRKCCQFCRYVS